MNLVTRAVSRKRTNDSSENQDSSIIKQLNFKYDLRGYQKEILDLVSNKFNSGAKEIHIVAPPGAGKTIIGLQILSQLKKPGLILSPNTTIQSQWSQKISLFLPENSNLGPEEIIGTHEDVPLKPITTLTYQVLSTASNEQEYLENLARSRWIEELKSNRGLSVGEAEIRILELLQNNKSAYKKEISRHTTKVRRKLADVLDVEEVLHKNALEIIRNLRRTGVETIIFDECHHLTDYWAAIMHHVIEMLDDPYVIALTGTPPEGKSQDQSNRYSSLVGRVDYQVPTPALVREGGLSPFQDLVYFTRPTKDEYSYLALKHQGFWELSKELIGKNLEDDSYSIEKLPFENNGNTKGSTLTPDPQISDYATCEDLGFNSKYDVKGSNGNSSYLLSWLFNEMLSIAKSKKWNSIDSKKSKFQDGMCRALWYYKLPVPKEVSNSKTVVRPPDIDDWMIILEELASTKLKTSNDPDDHDLYKRIKDVCRELGYGLTEGGLRKQASPIDRLLAFSKSKGVAVNNILEAEFKNLQESLRAIVVADFEKMSATGSKSIEGILDTDAGGAIAVYRTMLNCELSAFLNPCLVSGSSLLTDKRISIPFVNLATKLLRKKGFLIDIEIESIDGEPFDRIISKSSSWEPRLYVRIATEIFENKTGITKCLVGTRGLFGEGWDSQELNTLIDLTSATSPVTVNQLRGRSIRINTREQSQRKVANNWDVVCIAPELDKGLNDYFRFIKKHKQFFGISDDGQIEKGVGHVHPDFSEITDKKLLRNKNKLNEEMILRAHDRESIYKLWKVKDPYRNKVTNCIEVKPQDDGYIQLVPPHLKYSLSQKEFSRQVTHNQFYLSIETWLFCLAFVFVGHFIFNNIMLTAAFSIVCILATEYYRKRRLNRFNRKYQGELFPDNSEISYLKSICHALLSAMKRRSLLSPSAHHGQILLNRRSGGSARIMLQTTIEEDNKVFLKTLKELLGAISNQKFIVARKALKLKEITCGTAVDPTISEEQRLLSNNSTQPPLPPQKSQSSAYDQQEVYNNYLNGTIRPEHINYHPVPQILAKSQKGREAFIDAWNKYVSPQELIEADKRPDLVAQNFGIGPTVQDREIWD